jgi:hypothetical protein
MAAVPRSSSPTQAELLMPAAYRSTPLILGIMCMLTWDTLAAVVPLISKSLAEWNCQPQARLPIRSVKLVLTTVCAPAASLMSSSHPHPGRQYVTPAPCLMCTYLVW